MKKLAISLIGLLILSMGIYSCTKESDKTSNYHKKSSSNQQFNIVKFTDAELETIGQKHNDIFIEFFDIYQLSNYSPSINDFKNLTIEYTTELSPNFTINSLNDHINYSLESSSQLDKINYYEGILNTILATNTTAPEIESAINSEMVLIKNNNNLNNLEYNCIMSMFSVAKHSSKLWMPKSMGGTGVGSAVIRAQIDIGTNENDIPISDRAKKIIAQDGKGAAVGLLGWCCRAGYLAYTGGPLLGTASLIASTLGPAAYESMMALMAIRKVEPPFFFTNYNYE